MPPAETNTLELRLPRVLLDPGRSDLPCGDDQGLLSVRLHWRGAVVEAIEAIEVLKIRLVRQLRM